MKIPSPLKVIRTTYIIFDTIVLLSLLIVVRAFKWTFRIGRRYR
jgi:hypothetical protein